jgi:hypothetical protein
MINLEIVELLESLIEEVAFDEENKDAILHEYAARVEHVIEEYRSIFSPEETQWID